ncbi:MAG: efflux RND transporter permease subunit [bacterium]
MLRKFLENHVLANLTFGLILVLGALSYVTMPKSNDPDINFNWITIFTTLPGASSLEVEKRVTDPLEDAISSSARDLRFVSSTSRDGISTILVRFNDMSDREFDKHLADLRREIQNAYNDQLPDEASDPIVREITTSSGFPTATLALTAPSQDDDFRRYAARLKKEVERLKGVDEALMDGIEDPELHIAFYPERLEGLGITPADIGDTVRAYFRDVALGDIESENGKWVVRLEGTSGSLEKLESFPIVGAKGVVPLGSLADIYHAMAEPRVMVRLNQKPAVMYTVTKQEGVNILDILERLNTFLAEENSNIDNLGYKVTLIDDQTIRTREAISLMQNNALIGLCLVVLVAFLFLGGHISLLTSIGIPFTLAGTFLVLNLMGMSVNGNVLIGVVIALGMIVDDAVVVVEAMYYRLQRGADAMTAAIESLQEVAAPVLTSVLTTISVFLPLMLLPGVLGQFMRVIPIVVCVALAISLLEAFWMLPAHVAALGVKFDRETEFQRKRRIYTRRIRHFYSLVLIRALRWPLRTLAGIAGVFVLASILAFSGAIKMDFFAGDPFRVFYVNAELPNGSSLAQSLAVAEDIEADVNAILEPGERKASISFSGVKFTQTEPLFGDNLSQVMVTINPHERGMRDVRDIVAAVKQAISDRRGEADISVLLLEDGPPVGKPINMKVRGREFEEIQVAVDDIRAHMRSQDIFSNISIDFRPGNPEMSLSLDGDAIKRAGVSPSVVTRTLQSYVDGELVTNYQHLGEEVDVRVLTRTNHKDVDALLRQTVVAADGRPVALGEMLNIQYGYGQQNIRHYNFLRAVTISADIDESRTDTVAANQLLIDYWESVQSKYPRLAIDFSGELDDIQESLDGLLILFAMGLGLVYLVLGTQFKSYVQPVLILVSVPLAFSGVIFGLVLTNNPMSLMTMYGVVALSGISVNAAIVLISAANQRLESGMNVLHATIFAARRRVIPILITSFTTIAGLFSLAAGFAGKSLVWGPVATAIISGLMFSTVLILIVIPLLYRATANYFHTRKHPKP